MTYEIKYAHFYDSSEGEEVRYQVIHDREEATKNIIFILSSGKEKLHYRPDAKLPVWRLAMEAAVFRRKSAAASGKAVTKEEIDDKVSRYIDSLILRERLPAKMRI